MTDELRFPILRTRTADTVVVGGGVAGCAAAISAARHGAKTVLIEKTGVLGGQATLGLVTPLDAAYTRSGKSFGGLVAEISADVIATGERYTSCGEPGKEHYPLRSPHILKYILLKKALETGVEVLFHTTLVSAQTEGRRVTAADILTKSGFERVTADTFIDASGDADLVVFSGADCVSGSESGVFSALSENGMDKRHFSDETYGAYKKDGVMQPVSIFFAMGGVDVDKAAALNNKRLTYGDLGITKERFAKWRFAGTCGFEIADGDRVPMPQGRVLVTRGAREDIAVVNMSRVTGVNGADAESLNEGEIKAQMQLVALIDFLQTFIPGFENSYYIQSGSTLGIRETRRLVGREVLSGAAAIHCLPNEERVARGSYMIDIHDPNGKAAAVGGDLRGDFYDIPYGCLLAKEYDNLLACGRCLSADHVAHASTRIQGTCILTGQAAGTAAALAKAQTIAPALIPATDLRAQLIRDGVYLD